jgi:hypothetical protein
LVILHDEVRHTTSQAGELFPSDNGPCILVAKEDEEREREKKGELV